MTSWKIELAMANHFTSVVGLLIQNTLFNLCETPQTQLEASLRTYVHIVDLCTGCTPGGVKSFVFTYKNGITGARSPLLDGQADMAVALIIGKSYISSLTQNHVSPDRAGLVVRLPWHSESSLHWRALYLQIRLFKWVLQAKSSHVTLPWFPWGRMSEFLLGFCNFIFILRLLWYLWALWNRRPPLILRGSSAIFCLEELNLFSACLKNSWKSPELRECLKTPN